MQIPFRDIAKTATRVATSSATYMGVRSAIASHTEMDDDDIIVKSVSTVSAFAVTATTSPYTDAAVDRVADKLVAFRNRKTNPETTESAS